MSQHTFLCGNKKGNNILQGQEPTSQKRMKKTIRYSEKHSFKSVSCCWVPFRCSDKSLDRGRECSKKQSIYKANLMHNFTVIVENTCVQFSCKVIKILCLSVLNDDNTLLHKICKYKYFHPWYIPWAYSFIIKTTKKLIKMTNWFEQALFTKSCSHFHCVLWRRFPPWYCGCKKVPFQELRSRSCHL